MNDIDQSSVAASGPHRRNGDDRAGNGSSRKASIWARLRAALTGSPSLRANLEEALEVEIAQQAGGFSANERAILKNVLKLGEMRVDDVMVPRADIEAAEASENIAVLLARFRDAGHSRLPVYEENLDRIIGFVHIKDALKQVTVPGSEASGSNGNGHGNGSSNGNGAHMPVKLVSPALRHKTGRRDLVRKVLFVPPSMPVGDLLQKMQATRVHMAIVVDEYGGTDGLVTIEDLLEAVVGDIEDEHDEEDETLVRKIDENTFIASARVELTELQEIIGPDFEPGEHADDVDTLGGLVFDLIDRVPVRGEVITRLKGFELEILQADARRIKKVRIVRRKRAARPRPPKLPEAAPAPVPEKTAE